MPRYSGSTSILTVADSGNVLSGRLEADSPRRRSAIEIGAITTATGVKATLTVGDRNVMVQELIPFTATVTATELRNAVLSRIGAFPGERVSLSFYNSTAGTLVVTWVVNIVPL